MSSLFPHRNPTLPSFQTLLITGDYHATAPLHLCISHAQQAESTKALLLVPSRTKFVTTIEEFNDDWVNEHGGDGITNSAARKIQILYPPTPAHTSLLLSLFHEAIPAKGDYINAKATFETTPSMIVLYEPSSYFLDEPDATVSSYLTLIANALSCTSRLSTRASKPTVLAVFDSSLGNLRLPILPNVFEGGEDTTTNRRESVAILVKRYFEWIGTVYDDTPSPSSVPEEVGLDTTKRTCRMELRRVQESDDLVSESGLKVTWEWAEKMLLPNNSTAFAFRN